MAWTFLRHCSWGVTEYSSWLSVSVKLTGGRPAGKGFPLANGPYADFVFGTGRDRARSDDRAGGKCTTGRC